MRIEKTHATNFLNTVIIKHKSFPNYFSLARIFVFMFLGSSTLFISSCKDPGLTEIDLQPVQDKLGVKYFTTSAISSVTLMDDSAAYSFNREHSLLGSYKDPIFGKTEASFATQFQLSNTNPIFKWNDNGVERMPTIDSLVLSIAYYSYYGDIAKLNGLQQVKVFEVTKDLPAAGDTVFSNKNMSSYFDSTQPIAVKKFLPQPFKPVQIAKLNDTLNGTFTSDPQIRIQLDTAVFAKKIMAFQTSDYVNLTNQALFKNFFKGLIVKVENPYQTEGQGSILYLDLLNSNGSSKITAYFHDTISKSFVYTIDAASCNRINLFKHDYAAAPLINQQLTNPAVSYNQVFVQATEGLKAKIVIPVLTQLIDSTPIAIDRAEIIIKVDEPFIGKFVPSPGLFLYGIGEDGKSINLPDYIQNDGYAGATYDATNKQYKFIISRYAQLVATKKIKDNGFYIRTGALRGLITAYRVVLQGGTNIQFNLTYTKL